MAALHTDREVEVVAYDVTAPLRADLPTWPGEEGLRWTLVADLEQGDDATVSHLQLGAHTGTHVDAPVHFLPGGGGVESLDLDALIGPAVVLDGREVVGAITGPWLATHVPDGVERVLVRTRNSGWSAAETGFRVDFVAYDRSAAGWAVDRGVRLLGIDYLSIERFGAGEEDRHPVHRTLLEAGVVILEGLDLVEVPPGAYELLALPLLVPGADGTPARVVLRDLEP